MKNFLLATVLASVAIFLTGCFGAASQERDLLNDTQTFLPYDVIVDQSCKDKRDNIDHILTEANFCTVASDCRIVTEFGCPFDCVSLVNTSVKIEGIQKFIADYHESCMQCLYSCPAPPSAETVRCVQGQCIFLPPEPPTV